MTFDVTMKAEINRRWPDDPHAVRKRAATEDKSGECDRSIVFRATKYVRDEKYVNFIVETHELGALAGQANG